MARIVRLGSTVTIKRNSSRTTVSTIIAARSSPIGWADLHIEILIPRTNFEGRVVPVAMLDGAVIQADERVIGDLRDHQLH